MEKAILTIFFDGCPSDWLQENQSDTWHTFAYIVVPMLPTKINIPYTNMIHELNKTLPQGLGKWAGRRKKLQEKYREKFIDLFPQFWVNAGIWVNAVSFQEKELKIGKKFLLEKFSQDFLIGFRQYIGDNGKLRMRHEFVDFNGFHVIDLPENKILVLVLIAQLFVEQYLFYKKKAQEEGFDEFEMIIFSDNLSGDDAARNFSLQALSNMINPSQFETLNIQLTSSSQENQQPGDYFVDNLAGWFNECISNPAGYFSNRLLKISSLEKLLSWYQIVLEDNKITKHNALILLASQNVDVSDM